MRKQIVTSIHSSFLVIDNEICGMALRLVEGITSDESMNALEVISKVGAGGHYLGEKHTIDYLKKEYFMPSGLIDRLSLEAERKQGIKDIVSRARETVDQTLEKHVPEPLPSDVENDLRNALKEIMTRYGIKSVPIL